MAGIMETLKEARSLIEGSDDEIGGTSDLAVAYNLISVAEMEIGKVAGHLEYVSKTLVEIKEKACAGDVALKMAHSSMGSCRKIKELSEEANEANAQIINSIKGITRE